MSLILFITPFLMADLNWHNNIEDALDKAAVNDKYVFVFFTGSDWCSWCHKLTDEVFDHDEFQTYVKKNMEMVLLDFPRSTPQDQATKKYNEEKRDLYGIRGYPSVIILESNGEIAMQLGYREGGPVEYVKYIEGVLNWDSAELEEPYISPSGQKWYRNLDQAQKLAQEQDKHILINFTGSDWCTWCHRLRDEVFEQPEFTQFSNDELILVRFDFPKSIELPAGEESYNMKMAQKYGVRGFPSIFLLNKKGITIKKFGYEAGGPENYINMLEDQMK
ncbi:MAG TPA: thioredoxin family protein [Bacteroidales bacterium]|jgi:protein disulfide-isomerase|nr:thioredoxin family protein [Bacteroidales bacterium]